MLQIGSLLDNKYKILSEVGHGGMSVVYLAINERANKTWAVKEIRKDGVMDFESVKQGLVVETDMLKKLNHPHLPSIIDVIDTDDSFIIVMDYIEGSSLQKQLKIGGAQSEEKVVKWGKQLCDVLGYLHTQNPPIIYRDMKPANVMLKPDGNVMLIDFGTAREFKNRAMVEDTTCLGTRGYAAPEQFGGKGQTDARTDIYCLGATLYHLLTGHSPAEPPYEIKPLSYWIPQYLGSGLEKLIRKCTQQDPAARYQSCAELYYALEHYKDEDDIVMKQRRGKWNRFLACVIAGVIGLGGTIGFSLAKSAAVQDSYDYQISVISAESEAESAEKIKTLKEETLILDVDDYSKAYDLLIDIVNEDITTKGYYALNSEVDSLLKSSAGGSAMTNKDKLKQLNPVTYANLEYNIGIWYFFVKNKNGATDQDRITAGKHFEEAVGLTDENGNCYLDGNKVYISNTLIKISDFIKASQTSDQILTGQKLDYSGLYDTISVLADDEELITKIGIDYYSIKIYGQLACFIKDSWGKFEEFHSKDEQIQLLNKLSQRLDKLKPSENEGVLREAWDGADGNITSTKNELSANTKQENGGK